MGFIVVHVYFYELIAPVTGCLVGFSVVFYGGSCVFYELIVPMTGGLVGFIVVFMVVHVVFMSRKYLLLKVYPY